MFNISVFTLLGYLSACKLLDDILIYHYGIYATVEMVAKEVTVALLKPDIVKEGKTDEVLAKV